MLVVDDKRNMVRLMSKVLRSDATVRTAESGGDALRLLASEPIDVVLCDLKMPDMDGEVCAREMLAVRPELIGRIVHMSGDSIAHPEPRDFLMKPMSPEEILDVVARVVGREGVTT